MSAHGSRSKIVIGDEQPLHVEHGGDGPPDRREVNLRWLAGTVLTGVTSVALMGGALIAALDGWNSFAPPTFRAADQAASARADRTPRLLKADRIEAVEEIVADTRKISVPTRIREGEAERIILQPFHHVTKPLSLKAAKTSVEIPRFNPLKIFASGEDFTLDASNQSVYTANVDGEVEIDTVELPATFEETAGQTSADDAILALIGKLPIDQSKAVTATLVSNYQDQDVANYQGDGTTNTSPMTITEENVSYISKNEDTGESQFRERIIVVKEGHSLGELLKNEGVETFEIAEISGKLASLTQISQLTGHHALRLAYDQSTDGQKPARVSIYHKQVHQATIALSDRGAYISANKPQRSLVDLIARADDPGPQAANAPGAVTLYRSIYQSTLSEAVPKDLVDQLIRIFAFDVDFNQRPRRGDSLEVFYSSPDEADLSLKPEILYASITIGGTKQRYYKFIAPNDDEASFFNPDGKSSKKFLLRKPVAAGRFTSGYGYRRDPLRRYRRMHAGVDWAAKRGTPIMAAGNGRVKEIKWHAGYGRYIRLKHANGYETAYAHMTRWARGLREGSRVRQGQIIGYVGSTGRSTGPHLHYEVYVNNRHVNPMRIRVPRGKELSGDALALFLAERARIDKLVIVDDKKAGKLAAVR